MLDNFFWDHCKLDICFHCKQLLKEQYLTSTKVGFLLCLKAHIVVHQNTPKIFWSGCKLDTSSEIPTLPLANAPDVNVPEVWVSSDPDRTHWNVIMWQKQVNRRLFHKLKWHTLRALTDVTTLLQPITQTRTPATPWHGTFWFSTVESRSSTSSPAQEEFFTALLQPLQATFQKQHMLPVPYPRPEWDWSWSCDRKVSGKGMKGEVDIVGGRAMAAPLPPPWAWSQSHNCCPNPRWGAFSLR